MSDERIDIQITDKVDESIRTKLDQIAKAAQKGHNFVELLKSSLARFDASPVQRLTEASNANSAALIKQATAQERLNNIQSQGHLIAARTATEQQRLATESARTAAAKANEANAIERATAAKARASAETARLALEEQRLATQTARTATEQQRLATEVAKTAQAEANASAARTKAQVELERLSLMTAQLATEQQRLATQTARTSQAQMQANISAAKLATEQARLNNVQAQGQLIAAKIATEQQKLATEVQRTAEAEARAAAASDRAAAASQKAAQALKTKADATEDAIRIISRHTRSIEEVEAAEARFAEAQKGWSNDSNWREQYADQNARYAKTLEEMKRAADDAGQSEDQLAKRVAALKAQLDPLSVALQAQRDTLTELNRVKALGGISDAEFTRYEKQLELQIEQTTRAIEAKNLAMAKGVPNAKALQMNIMNLGRQFADIGVTAAMGMPIWMILIQQGPQIADGFQMASLQGLTFKQSLAGLGKTAATAAAVLAPLVVVGGTVALMFAGLHRELSKKYPKDITDNMGLSAEQLERVKSRTVTFKDTVGATFATLGEDIKAGPLGRFWDWFTEKTGLGVDSFFKNFRWGVAGVVALFKAGGSYIADRWDELCQNLKSGMSKAYNFIAKKFETFLNHKISGINTLIKALNLIPSIDIKAVAKIELPRLPEVEAAGASSGRSFGSYFAASLTDEIRSQESFMSRVGANALKRAQDRAREEAGKANKTSKGGGAGKEGFDRAGELAKINGELDGQIARMGMLSEAREVQNRLDQIASQFAQNNADLSDSETAALRAKLEVIQEYAHVQREMDSIYENVTSGARTHAAATEAANGLFDDGKISAARYAFEIERINRALEASKDHAGVNEALRTFEARVSALRLQLAEGNISLERFNREMVIAKNTFEAAEDPLHSFKVALESAEATMGKYGLAAQQAVYYESIRQALADKGIILTQTATEALKAEVAEIIRRNNALMQQQAIERTIGEIVNPLNERQAMLDSEAAYYAELERLRTADGVSEYNYQIAKAKLERKFQEMRLQGASDFFGALAGLASSGNDKIAAIGKAAAITQATMNMFVAASEALKLPFPANIPAIAQVMAQGAAIVGQIRGQSTHVGSFANGTQFMVSGRDGVDANNINMNVTNGERVTVETPAQQRAHDAALAGGAPAPVVENKIINSIDPNMMLDVMDTPAGVKVTINHIKANKREIRAALGIR